MNVATLGRAGKFPYQKNDKSSSDFCLESSNGVYFTVNFPFSFNISILVVLVLYAALNPC